MNILLALTAVVSLVASGPEYQEDGADQASPSQTAPTNPAAPTTITPGIPAAPGTGCMFPIPSQGCANPIWAGPCVEFGTGATCGSLGNGCTPMADCQCCDAKLTECYSDCNTLTQGSPTYKACRAQCGVMSGACVSTVPGGC